MTTKSGIRALLPHQSKHFIHMTEKSRLAVFWEMRLGKTLMAIRWAEGGKARKVLVICPLTVVRTWQDELAMERITPGLLLGPAKEWSNCLKDREIRWYVTNYERVRCAPALVTLPWDVVVLDESTRIRNPKAKTTKLIVDGGFHDVVRKAVLSGYPNPESPLDFFMQMKFLYGSFMGCNNYWQFRDRYFRPRFLQWDWQPKSGALDEIKAVVRARTFILTRKQAGLPDMKVREARYVSLPPKIMSAYKKAEKTWRLECQNRETKYAIVAANWLHRITGGSMDGLKHTAKTNEVIELLQGELAGTQVVIWFRYNRELYRVRNALRLGPKIACAGITGKVPVPVRRQRMDKFRSGEVRVLLCQARCAMMGLDFSVADTAIYYSRYFDGEVNVQTEDRIVHPLKKRPLLLIDLVTQGTVDEDVLSAVRQKKLDAAVFRRELLTKLKGRLGHGNTTTDD